VSKGSAPNSKILSKQNKCIRVPRLWVQASSSFPHFRLRHQVLPVAYTTSLFSKAKEPLVRFLILMKFYSVAASAGLVTIMSAGRRWAPVRLVVVVFDLDVLRYVVLHCCGPFRATMCVPWATMGICQSAQWRQGDLGSGPTRPDPTRPDVRRNKALLLGAVLMNASYGHCRKTSVWRKRDFTAKKALIF